MSDEPYVWRGTMPVAIQVPSMPMSMSFQKCLECGALLSEGVWEHEVWHRKLAGEMPIQPIIMPRALEDVMGHVDALYIFLGEDPPYNVGSPDG